MADFFEVCRGIQGRTLITPDRLWTLWSWINDTISSVEGEVAELGSYKGGSAMLLSRAIEDTRRVHIFDTFSGVPAELTDSDVDYVLGDHPHLNVKWAGGFYQGGEWPAAYEDVVRFLRSCKSISIHKGLVPDILSEVEDETFCFVHLDMDIYEPTKCALDFFWERLNTNGVIMLDDYKHLYGVTRAVSEFADKKQIPIVDTAFMQCAIRKIV